MTPRERLRRTVHILLGGGAFLLPVLGWKVVAALCAAAVLFNALLLRRLPLTRLLHRRDESGLRGLVLYPAVLLVALLLFRSDHAPVQAGWIALALGDGLAPFFGLALRTPRWPHLAAKSVPASVAAFAVAGLVIAVVAPWPLALAAALGGLAGEAASSHVDDNFGVPAGAIAGFVLARGLGAA